MRATAKRQGSGRGFVGARLLSETANRGEDWQWRSLGLDAACLEDMAGFPDKVVCQAVGKAKCTPSILCSFFWRSDTITCWNEEPSAQNRSLLARSLLWSRAQLPPIWKWPRRIGALRREYVVFLPHHPALGGTDPLTARGTALLCCEDPGLRPADRAVNPGSAV